MDKKDTIWKMNIKKTEGYFLLITLLLLLLSVSYVASVPMAPVVSYISNTTYTSGVVNRSTDAKGTITTVTIDARQQDYKWKAYVGNVSGTLALANAAGTAIYGWATGSPNGEVYVSRFSNINWGSINCTNQAAIDAEQGNISMSATARDSINATFNYTNHIPFDVGTTPMSGCRSTATYRNGAPQTMGPGAYFQEILLRDTTTNNLVYASIINASTTGYNNQPYDFQIIIGENESATVPTMYYFWVEIGG